MFGTLSPFGLRQDLDGRWSEKMQEFQWKQAAAASHRIRYSSEGDIQWPSEKWSHLQAFGQQYPQAISSLPFPPHQNLTLIIDMPT